MMSAPCRGISCVVGSLVSRSCVRVRVYHPCVSLWGGRYDRNPDKGYDVR